MAQGFWFMKLDGAIHPGEEQWMGGRFSGERRECSFGYDHSVPGTIEKAIIQEKT